MLAKRKKENYAQKKENERKICHQYVDNFSKFKKKSEKLNFPQKWQAEKNLPFKAVGDDCYLTIK